MKYNAIVTLFARRNEDFDIDNEFGFIFNDKSDFSINLDPNGVITIFDNVEELAVFYGYLKDCVVRVRGAE